MKKINILPKLFQIEISEEHFGGRISPTITATPYYYFKGFKHYKWLWFNFKRKYSDFDISNGRLTFDKVYPNVKIQVNYLSK